MIGRGAPMRGCVGDDRASRVIAASDPVAMFQRMKMQGRICSVSMSTRQTCVGIRHAEGGNPGSEAVEPCAAVGRLSQAILQA